MYDPRLSVWLHIPSCGKHFFCLSSYLKSVTSIPKKQLLQLNLTILKLNITLLFLNKTHSPSSNFSVIKNEHSKLAPALSNCL